MQPRRQFGAHFILKSLERPPPSVRCCQSSRPGDPDYRIFKRNWSRYRHYYFNIQDEVLGTRAVRACARVGSGQLIAG